MGVNALTRPRPAAGGAGPAGDAEAVRLLTALGDPVRLELLSLLSREGRLNVGAIAARFRITRPAISHHLRVLKDAGAVGYEKVGQEGIYWIDRERIAGTLRAIAARLEGCGADVAGA
jgi:DNA-binding transcriptional ArsR family regulator